ncbi:protein translocase subunit SecDF [Mycoplasma sp. 773]
MNKKNKISPAIKWVFSIFIFIGMLLAFIFGSIFYLTPTLNKFNRTNNEIIGTKTVLKIQKNSNQTSSKNELQPNKIADIVKQYLQEKGDKLTSNYDVNLLSNNLIEVKDLSATDDKSQKQLLDSLIKKPNLTITDHNGNPLFYKGRYQGNESSFHGLKELIDEGSQNFNMDLDPNPASDKIPEGYADRIQIKLNSYAWDQFTHLAYDYFIRGFQQQGQGQDDPSSKVYFWLNLDEFIQNAIQNDRENWDRAKNNPVNYAYANNKAGDDVTRDKDGKVLKTLKPSLKYSINAQRYLISAISPISLISSKKRDSIFYLINNISNGYSNKQLTSLINFSYTPFKLEKQTSYFITKSYRQFDSYIIAIVVMWAVMSLFLLIKYRLLGVTASVTLAFLIFVFLSIITAFGVVINSIIGLTVIMLLFIAFSLLIRKLHIFAKEIKEGSNTNKAINKATKRSLISGLDVVAVIGIGAILAFYLNINHSSTIGALMGIGALLISFIVIGLNTILFRLIIQTESFDNKKYLLLSANKKIHKFTLKINNFFKVRLLIIPIIAILMVSILIFGSFSGIQKSALLGFNVDSNLKFKFIYSVGLNFKNGVDISGQTTILNELQNFIISHNEGALIEKVKASENGLNSLLIYSNMDMSNLINNELLKLFNSKNYADVTLVTSSNALGNNSIGYSTAWISLLMLLTNICIFIYITVRYSMQSAVIFIVKQILLIGLVLGIFIIFRTKIDNFVFDGLLFVSFINIVDSVINSSIIKDEILKDTNTKNFIYNPTQVHNIIKILISDTFTIQTFNVILGFVLLSSAPFLLVSVSFNAIFSLQLALLFTWYLNMFIIPRLLEHLINLRYKNKHKRIENDFWKTEKIQEQTFIGINDFSM